MAKKNISSLFYHNDIEKKSHLAVGKIRLLSGFLLCGFVEIKNTECYSMITVPLRPRAYNICG